MESSLLRLCPEPYDSGLVEPPICCSPINYNSWFLKEGYFKGGFFASEFKLVRELDFPHEQAKIMKKQAPIVFWDFEIDKEKKIAFRKDKAR